MKKKKRQRKNKVTFKGIQLHKKKYRHHNNEVTFWTMLMIILVCTLLSSLVLILLFLVLKPASLLVSLLGFALLFGWIFAHLLRSIPNLSSHHHIVGLIITSLISLLSVAFAVTMSNGLSSSLGIAVVYPPLTIGVVYTALFLVPYGLHHFID